MYNKRGKPNTAYSLIPCITSLYSCCAWNVSCIRTEFFLPPIRSYSPNLFARFNYIWNGWIFSRLLFNGCVLLRIYSFGEVCFAVPTAKMIHELLYLLNFKLFRMFLFLASFMVYKDMLPKNVSQRGGLCIDFIYPFVDEIHSDERTLKMGGASVDRRK